MSELSVNDPFSDYPVIGRLSNETKAKLLYELGDKATGDEFIASGTSADTKSLFGGTPFEIPRKLKPWEHTSHSFGFLPSSSSSTNTPLSLFNASQIDPDLTLLNKAITIRLDKIRVSDYPGSGQHRILFDFSARNSLSGGQHENLRFNSTYRAREGQDVAAVGLPIFVGLTVGDVGLAFTCNTVNVANIGSEKALEMLDSDLVKGGLKLATIAQPAIGPLSQIALGLTKAILGANNNIRVQEFQLGLDFEAAATGARLAQGSYFAIQVEDASAWDWSRWLWHPSQARLVSKSDHAITCPYNYIVFRVSRYLGS